MRHKSYVLIFPNISDLNKTFILPGPNFFWFIVAVRLVSGTKELFVFPIFHNLSHKKFIISLKPKLSQGNQERIQDSP